MKAKDNARIEEMKAKFGMKYHPAEIAEMSDAELKAMLIGKRVKTFYNGKEYFGTIVEVFLNDRKNSFIASKYGITFDDGTGAMVFANKVTFI